MTQVDVLTYEDAPDRAEVIGLWQTVFPDDPPWNEPTKVLDQRGTRDPELFLVARVDGRLVATVVGGYDGVRGWMYHLATHPDFRKRGIARTLIGELETRLARLGCVKLNLQVRQGNYAVAEFYEKLGYVTEARVSLGKKLHPVSPKRPLSSIDQPVPELPVSDVERAQQYYRDTLGFEIGWLYPNKEIGAVTREKIAIFFRRREPPFEPAVHWVFADDIDATYAEMKSSGANIVEPLEQKPWGLRQFTIDDLDGNRFQFHHD